MATFYCTAKHTDSPNGCYEWADHEGDHRGFRPYSALPFYWSDAPEPEPTPEGTPVYLTEAELYLIGYTFCDVPRVKGLMDKIDAALEALK